MEERERSRADLGRLVRAARQRRGWTREALAHHAGLSWAAVVQIESGRRTDPRLSTVVALADALEMPLDHLAGRVRTEAVLEHEVLAYAGVDEFLAGIVPYVRDGVARSEAVFVVTTARNRRALTSALGDESDAVTFALSTTWYRAPMLALNGYRRYVEEHQAAGASWVRIVGEPVWTGRTDAEVRAWTRYESLINVSFAASPATIVCPYDRRVVPSAVVEDAHRTHPDVRSREDRLTSDRYDDAEAFLIGS